MGCFVIKTVSLKTELLENMIYFDFPPSLPMSRLKGKFYCVYKGKFLLCLLYVSMYQLLT